MLFLTDTAAGVRQLLTLKREVTPRSRTFLCFIVLFTIGFFSLMRTELYYGHLLTGWDAQFYYAQARSLVLEGNTDITNDLALTPFQSPFDSDGDGFLERPPRNANGQIINKYPIGLSILEIPWLSIGFIVRRAWEILMNQRLLIPLGYSRVEIWAVAIGLLFYTVLGLVALCRVVQNETRIAWPELAVVATWSGTSLFYYSAVFPFMAHGVSFALVVGILYIVSRLESTERHKPIEYHALGALAGTLLITRPQQVLLLALLIPFGWKVLRAGRVRKTTVAVSAVVFLSITLLLPIHNYMQSAVFAFDAYSVGAREGFDWLRPKLAIVLVSATRGVLWMNPIVLLSVWGYILLHKAHSYQSMLPWVLSIHAAVQLYVISCWSSPAQGDAFGSRMWIEAVPFVAVGIGSLMRKRSSSRGMYLVLILAAVAWTSGLMMLYVKGKLESGVSHGEIALRLGRILLDI